MTIGPRFQLMPAVLAACWLGCLFGYHPRPGVSTEKPRAALRRVGLGRVVTCLDSRSALAALPLAYFVRKVESGAAVVRLALPGEALLERWVAQRLVLRDLEPEHDELLREDEPRH